MLRVYGPTESGVFASYYEINSIDEKMGTVPIGIPLSNTTLYIVDNDMNLQPVGVEGELYIGGDSLVQGYLNRPDITAERFIVSPFTDGEIIYKSGDRAKWLPDGNLQFIGRTDHQVKIRGFRIELGEIQNVLSSHAAVDKAKRLD